MLPTAMILKCVCKTKHPTQKESMRYGQIYERRKTDHENHETEHNCFRNKGTRKQIAETPKLTPMDTSTSLAYTIGQYKSMEKEHQTYLETAGFRLPDLLAPDVRPAAPAGQPSASSAVQQRLHFGPAA